MPSPTFFVVNSGSKIRERTSGGMPGPVSEISTSTQVPPSPSAGLDAELAAALELHRVDRVVDDVEKDLLQLVGVAAHRGQVRRAARALLIEIRFTSR